MPSAIHLFFIAAALPFLGRDRPTGPARLPKNLWHYTCHYIAGRASGSVSTIDRARRLGQREGYDGEREIRDEDAEADRRPPRAQPVEPAADRHRDARPDRGRRPDAERGARRRGSGGRAAQRVPPLRRQGFAV